MPHGTVYGGEWKTHWKVDKVFVATAEVVPTWKQDVKTNVKLRRFTVGDKNCL